MSRGLRRALPPVVALLVAAAAALVYVSTAPAAGYSLPRTDVRVTVTTDGSIRVVEVIDVAFSGSFTFGYRDIPLRQGERVTDVSVAEGATEYRPGAPTRLEPGGQAGTYGTEVSSSRLRIVWRYEAASERRSFTVRYAMTGLVKAYDDVVDVNLKVWGDQWTERLDRLTATMTGPGPVRRAWGHSGTSRGAVSHAGPRAILTARAVAARQSVELRVLYPRSAFGSALGMKVVRGRGLSKIVAAERPRVTGVTA